MCIHIFNPPAPDCSPTELCGNCFCVPPFHKTIGAVQPGQHSDYEGLFMGEHILARNFQQFIGGGSCLWFLPMLFPSGIGTSIVDPSPGMYLQAQGGRGTREWTLSLIGSHFPGVPLDAAVYSNQAFGQPKAPWRCLFPNRLYLDPLAGSGNFVGMPPYFDIEPFWP